jgi:hypothetical protein
MSAEIDWEAPPLTPEDERLVDAYIRSGLALDELAYTQAFEDLVKSMGRAPTLDELHWAYKRLLNLRKRGRLPRLIDVRT